MAMKTKTLAFDAKSNFFIGSNYDNDGQLGIVTFGDNCEYDKKARQLTDEALEQDKGYELLNEISKSDIYSLQKNPLRKRAFDAKTEMWCLLFHNFLIEVLEENGWTIMGTPDGYELPTNLTDYAMVI